MTKKLMKKHTLRFSNNNNEDERSSKAETNIRNFY